MSTRVNRIEKEFIFKKIINNKTAIKILNRKREITGQLIKYNENHLIIQVMESELITLNPGDKVDIFFIFERNHHTFKTKVKEIKETELIVVQPEKIYKNLQRQYERITTPEDIKVYFTIKGKRIHLDFPKVKSYYPMEEPVFVKDFDTSNINSLIKSFRIKMSSIVSTNKIIMLRNSQPSTYEEKLMANTGKIIWFPCIEDGFLIKNEYPGYTLLTYKEINEYEISIGTLRSEISNKLHKLITDKFKNGFYSQLYCPILYNEYLIGYIYLCNSIEKKTKITFEILKYVQEFSRVLCYSLKNNQYFKVEKNDNKTYSVPIIDMSGSGLLFAYPEKKLSVELPLHSKIMIFLKIGKRKIEIKGEIVRKYNDTKTYYFAIKYTDITKEDFRFLYEFIYGKKYSIQSETMWESITDSSDLFNDI